ncbi:MAG TPA: PH domain-containing protein [Acidimicrobiales bacterium]|nr:PH domain-containing protein [Acidimicrobiales bacterium]
MGYPRKLLNPGEQVAVDVGPHWKYMARPALAVIVALALAVEALGADTDRWEELALAGVLVLCLLWLGVRYLKWVTTSFTVTNERLILRRGVLKRAWREILLDRLTDISCRQSLGDRLLGCGDILLESPGRDSQEVFPDLPHPLRIQKEIYRLVNARRLTAPGGAGGQPTDAKEAGAGGGASATAFPPTTAFSPADAATRAVAEATVAEQLSQLNDLRRRGVISRREYAAKKAELLARM